MTDQETNLHPKNNPSINLKPNIVTGNIPDKTVTFKKLDEDLQNEISRHSSLIATNTATTENLLSSTFEKNDNFDEYVNVNDISSLFIKGKALNVDGNLDESNNDYYTDYIDIVKTKVFFYTGASRWSFISYAIYDENKNFIKSFNFNDESGYGFVINKLVDLQEYPQAKYIRFGSSNWGFSYIFIANPKLFIADRIPANNSNKVVMQNINDLINITDELEVYTGGWLNYNSTANSIAVQNDICCQYSKKPYKVKEGDLLYVTCSSAYACRAILVFNDKGTIIDKYPSTDKRAEDLVNFEYSCPKDSAYIVFSSYIESSYGLNSVVFKNRSIKVFKSVKRTITTNAMKVDNKSRSVLNGKNYYSLGDSFTAMTWYHDGSYDMDLYSAEYRSWKTYPYFIAERNKMKLHNMAISGSYSHWDGESSSANSPLNPSSNQYYKKIGEDADYISLAFGMNELDIAIGDEDSIDTNTFKGAMNTMIKWLILNRPKAKILIIANDGDYTIKFRNACRELAEYWGVGYIGLKDKGIPLMIGGKYMEDGVKVSSEAVEIRNNYYINGNNDRHPDVNAQYDRSTIIEEALKSL